MTEEAASGIEPAPAGSAQVFGAQLSLAETFAGFLATAGVERGLIGPRETGRLWSRHLLNCAGPVELFPVGARVVDVGSGAGLPGIVFALARPDLEIDLVEPLARRAQFLTEAIELLDLGARVRVTRGRAEDREVARGVGDSRWVTARAVAPLDRLVRWCLPLLAPGGQLAAMKGSQASVEVAEHKQAITRIGGANIRIVECGAGLVDPPVTVVLVERGVRARKAKGKS